MDNHFYLIGSKSWRIRRNNANYTAIMSFKVIQGHRLWYQSKAHMRFVLVINISSYLAPLPSYGRLLVNFSLWAWECLTIPPLLGVIPCEYAGKLYSSETRGIVLPDAENRTILSSFVWTQYRNVTDGRTDRQNLSNTAL